MGTHFSLVRQPWLVCCVASATSLLSISSYASQNIIYPVRLSDRLFYEMQLRAERQQPAPFFPGIAWYAESEQAAQREQKLAILDGLRALAHKNAASTMYQTFFRYIDALPVTGRVVLPETDPYWLQAKPQSNPILQQENELFIPDDAPRTISILREDGSVCRVSHQPSVQVHYYVKQCLSSSATVDWVWVIQANGHVQKVGVAPWNHVAQEEAFPGAWIWMPTRTSDYSEALSQQLALFLATQGMALEKHWQGAVTYIESSGGLTKSFQHRSRDRDLAVTASDWGRVGLLQTPSARMKPEGELSMTYSNVYPYTRGTVMFQPFEDMEFGFRYSSVSNFDYGPKAFSGDQSFKDKSIDVKWRLLKESRYLPEMAVGLQDVAGTGLFSGEYLVASKRIGNFDWSVGLGWGYLGNAGNVKNPLSVISKKFDTRVAETGHGGTFSVKNYFRGSTALFGGVQYQTPWEPLLLKLEFDGNNYKKEPFSNPQAYRSSPVNIGAVYRWKPYLDLTAGVERGNQAMVGFHLHQNMANFATPKLSMPQPIPVEMKTLVTSDALSSAPSSSSLSGSIIKEMEDQTEWKIQGIKRYGSVWAVTILNGGGGYYMQERFDRMLAVLHRDAPLDVQFFTIRIERAGIVTAEYRVDRRAWMNQQTQAISPSMQRSPIVLSETFLDLDSHETTTVAHKKRSRFDGGLGVNYGQTLGGPDGFLLYQFAGEAKGRVDLWKGAFLAGTARVRLLDNYDKFKNTGSSDLPRVRTHLREYLTTARETIPLLQATQLMKLGDSHFFSLYGGYLESMFAGAGGEYLWRPIGSSFALGMDINQVTQRGFKQNFELLDYKTKTGHLTAYWNTGWRDIIATTSVGKYLAGDKGVTVDLSKTFHNGVTMGVFATKTNVSAEQFGEGSFNKGIYVTIPFDALATHYSSSKVHMLWTPLTRDGGAKLSRSVNLYDYTNARNTKALELHSAQ